MRGHRQGKIIDGYHDMGQEVALYDFSGLGVDLGDELDMASDYVTGLPTWAKAAMLAAAGVGVYALATGAVKMKKTKRKNPSRNRRNASRNRRNRRNRR